jgi:hypothetical protein
MIVKMTFGKRPNQAFSAKSRTNELRQVQRCAAGRTRRKDHKPPVFIVVNVSNRK